MLQGAVQSVQGAIGDTVGAVHLAAVQTEVEVLPRGLCRWAALPLGNAERCQTRKIIPRKCMERKKVYYHCAYTMF